MGTSPRATATPSARASGSPAARTNASPAVGAGAAAGGQAGGLTGVRLLEYVLLGVFLLAFLGIILGWRPVLLARFRRRPAPTPLSPAAAAKIDPPPSAMPTPPAEREIYRTTPQRLPWIPPTTAKTSQGQTATAAAGDPAAESETDQPEVDTTRPASLDGAPAFVPPPSPVDGKTSLN